VVSLAIAYVLITTATGRESKVLEHLRELPELGETHQLFGQYDIIARIETKDFDEMCDVVTGRVRTIPGVTGTRTLICARFDRK